jgi:phage shock protein PspC (stress-responsive transcriptional regulator)
MSKTSTKSVSDAGAEGTTARMGGCSANTTAAPAPIKEERSAGRSIGNWLILLILFLLLITLIYWFSRTNQTQDRNDLFTLFADYQVSRSDAILGGVCSGFSKHTIIPVWIWRIIWIGSLFVYPIPVVLLSYLIFWALGSRNL